MNVRCAAPAALAVLLLGLGCGENPNRMGNQAGNEPTTVTGGLGGYNHEIPVNESIGSQAVGRQTTLSEQDEDFIMNTAAGDLAEGVLGRLASSNASNDSLRGFGEQLTKDELVLHDELTKIAANNDVTLPYHMDPQQAADINRLVSLKGSDFDQAFVPLMINNTKSDIAALQTEFQQAGDESIRWYAYEMLPRLQARLRALQQIK